MKSKIKWFIDAFFSFLLFFSVWLTVLPSSFSLSVKLLGAVDLTLLCQSVYLQRSQESMEKSSAVTQMRNSFLFAPFDNGEWLTTAISSRYDVTKNGATLVCGNLTICHALTCSPLSYATVCGFYKSKRTERLLILCLDCDKKAKTLALSLADPVEIWEADQVYRLLTFLRHLPPPVQIRKKPSVQTVLSAFADAKLSRSYLIGAAVMLALSALSPFRKWYVGFAVFVFCLALIPPLLSAISRKERKSRQPH